jgi:hypothetical protein
MVYPEVHRMADMLIEILRFVRDIIAQSYVQYKDNGILINSCTLRLNQPAVMRSFSTTLVSVRSLFSVVPIVCVSSTLLLSFCSKRKTEISQREQKLSEIDDLYRLC